MNNEQKRKVILIISATIVGILAGFGFYKANENSSTNEIVNSTVTEIKENIENKSSTEIPQLTENDEQSLEVQETESEGFEEQGIVAYEFTF